MPEATAGAPARAQRPAPHIGAFVLETLTLGMYGEPRHTLREYVQNSFDAIRDAQRAKHLSGRGRVDVTLARDVITIRDNGIGVRAAVAWSTLTSVGASKKDRQRDVGFRGIGRMAGMAYCDALTFRTTFPGETVLTSLTFDCKRLLAAMDPDEGGDVELARLLDSAIRFEQTAAAAPEEHFLEVTMTGLAHAPPTLTDPASVRAYLAEHVPVDFAPDFAWAEAIRADYQTHFGVPLETIDVFVHVAGRDDPDNPDDEHATNGPPAGGASERTHESAGGADASGRPERGATGDASDAVTRPVAVQIFKPYGDTYSSRSGPMGISDVEFLLGTDNRYWGWIGHLNESGAVTDPATRGLRVRLRNIQVDGVAIFQGLFTDHKPSYARFSTYYVGEVHIAPEHVVPNARRDGFEETDAWAGIKEELVAEVCAPLAKRAYDASRARQIEVGKLVSDVDAVVARGRQLADSQRASYDQVVELMSQAKTLRRKTASVLKLVGDLDDAAADDADPGDADPGDADPAARGPGAARLQGERLRAAAQEIEGVEHQARMLVGRVVAQGVQIGELRQRLREELVGELLGIVRDYVDQPTYQHIKRVLAGGAEFRPRP